MDERQVSRAFYCVLKLFTSTFNSSPSIGMSDATRVHVGAKRSE